VTDLPVPTATRLRRPSWRDTRLLVGVLIVAASVALGARVVAAADRSVPVYATTTTLVTGRALSPSDLTVVRVHLGPGTATYLSARSPVPVGVTVVRTLGAGELVPISALGTSAAVQVRPVTVPLEGAPPAGLRAGTRVDVWSSAKDLTAGATTYQAPRRLAEAVEVSAVTGDGDRWSVARGSSVQVLLGRSELPAVLDGLANGARMVLIPVPGSAVPDPG
jgi:hypothetical protein